MKRKRRKLSLGRETVRRLEGPGLQGARGAAAVFTVTDDPGTVQATNCGTCNTICSCPGNCGSGGSLKICCTG
jgi:hypothetical protein